MHWRSQFRIWKSNEARLWLSCFIWGAELIARRKDMMIVCLVSGEHRYFRISVNYREKNCIFSIECFADIMFCVFFIFWRCILVIFPKLHLSYKHRFFPFSTANTLQRLIHDILIRWTREEAQINETSWFDLMIRLYKGVDLDVQLINMSIFMNPGSSSTCR